MSPEYQEEEDLVREEQQLPSSGLALKAASSSIGYATDGATELEALAAEPVPVVFLSLEGEEEKSAAATVTR